MVLAVLAFNLIGARTLSGPQVRLHVLESTSISEHIEQLCKFYLLEFRNETVGLLLRWDLEHVK